jgi:selenocysteine lyase/cysteine desulfurase
MVDIPIRDALGRPRAPDEIGQVIDGTVSVARMAGQHVLAHAVHVSKTGLIVPGLEEMDRLNAKYGWRLSWVVDACQARIAPATINAYLERGAIILLTGSKFIGGPPFSGFALVPEQLMAEAAPLPDGFGSLFRRGEWPLGWPGSAQLADGANPGLLMRLEAAVFELERYCALELWQVRRVVRSFRSAVMRLADRLGVSEVGAGGAAMPAEADPRGESATLVTLDLSTAAQDADLTDAQRWHQCLVGEGIRLGQPVRYAMGADGRWKPCLRISLSMPMIVERADMSTEQLDETFRSNFDRIGRTLATCMGRG